jgi:hypothetical protein
MHLLGSDAHLPIARDRGCHRWARLSGVMVLENVTEARLSVAALRFFRSLERFSASDAHLPGSKMHRRARGSP